MPVQIAPPFREDHKWNFPVGVIEDGEDIELGLLREVLEETNVVCEIKDLIDKFSTYDPENEIHIFNGKYISGKLNSSYMKCCKQSGLRLKKL